MLPRARLGPKPSEFAGSLVSDEKVDVRPRLALGNAVLQTVGSALCLAHDDEIGLLSRFRPDSVSSTKRSAAITL